MFSTGVATSTDLFLQLFWRQYLKTMSQCLSFFGVPALTNSSDVYLKVVQFGGLLSDSAILTVTVPFELGFSFSFCGLRISPPQAY